MLSKFSIHALTAVVACALCAGTAYAGVTPFGPPSGKKVGVRHMAPYDAKGGAFSDKYTFEGRLKGGGDIYFSIHHQSIGVGGAKFEVKTRYRDADGTVHRTRQKLGADKWSAAIDGDLKFQMDKHALVGTPRGWKLTAEGEGITWDVEMKPTSPAWRPGNGRAYFGGKSKYLDMTVLAPRAKITGTITINGEARELKGYGYALHSYSNLAYHELAKRMIGFRTERGKISFYFKEILPADKWGAEPVRWLVVTKGRKVLFESTDFTLVPGEFETDDKHENRYRIPHLLRIEAKDGDRTLVAAVKTKKRRDRKDRLAKLSAVERAVAARFAKPVGYSYYAAYQVRITEGEGEGATVQEFKGKGIYELDHVNK